MTSADFDRPRVPAGAMSRRRLWASKVEPSGSVRQNLGSPVVPFFGWEDSPTKIDYRKKGTLTVTSLLEDLGTKGFDVNCHQ